MIPFLPIALVGYTVGMVLAGVGTLYRSTTAHRAAAAVFVFTWAVHLAAIAQKAAAVGRMPLDNVGEYLLVLGWLVLTFHLYVWFRWRIQIAGMVLTPIAGLAALAAMYFMSPDLPGSAVDRGPWFLFHVTVSTLGIAILSVAFAMSLIYIVHDRALKSRKTLSLLERLPSLERCDRVGLQSLAAGFLLLTLGIGTGIAVNFDVFQQWWVFGIKQIFPVVAWLMFAGILGARTALGFRGRKSAYATMAGFAIVLLSVLGMTL